MYAIIYFGGKWPEKGLNNYLNLLQKYQEKGIFFFEAYLFAFIIIV